VQVQFTVRPGPDATPGKYRITITGKGADNTTREVSLTVVIVERATTRDDTPCLIAVLLILLAAVGAYAASRKAKQAEKERELLEARRLAEAEQTARKEALRKGKKRKKGSPGRPRMGV
jgi:hypothetical protein